MIIQLPSGRFIEVSVEQYLNMSDQDVKDLNALGKSYTKEYNNPFYSPFSSSSSEITLQDMDDEDIFDLSEEDLDYLDTINDPYFFPDLD